MFSVAGLQESVTPNELHLLFQLSHPVISLAVLCFSFDKLPYQSDATSPVYSFFPISRISAEHILQSSASSLRVGSEELGHSSRFSVPLFNVTPRFYSETYPSDLSSIDFKGVSRTYGVVDRTMMKCGH